jgi:protein-tyrosine phosphatase
MLDPRVLPLSGVHNFRDYGDYAVEGGGRVRRGLLWRSAHHEAATDEDLEHIDALGLAHVIDLRGDDERALHPCRRSAKFNATVLFAGGTTAGLAPHLAAATDGITADIARDRLTETYRSMPWRRALVGTMKLYFRTLSQQDSASLIHCVAGKDRTGLSVAILHHLLGVHHDDLMADYLLTNVAGNIDARIAQGGAHLRQRYAGSISDEAIRTLMSVDAVYLDTALAEIKAKHGSISAYAETVLDVDAAKRQSLVQQLVR